MNYLNMTDVQKTLVSKALNDFDFIGVRDVATENFVKYALPSKEVHHTCDPTIFLDMDKIPVDMLKLRQKLEKVGIDLSKPIIGMMGSHQTAQIIRKIYGDKYQIVAVYEPCDLADFSLCYLSPYEWARVFSFFSLTFSTFFSWHTIIA